MPYIEIHSWMTDEEIKKAEENNRREKEEFLKGWTEILKLQEKSKRWYRKTINRLIKEKNYVAILPLPKVEDSE